MNENWKDVIGYEGLYQVSDSGQVRSLPRNTTNGKKLKPLSNGIGYLHVNLYKDGKQKQLYIHRLVAEAFIPNPLNLPFINHKDENPSNNHVSNLEWCDNRYNLTYGTCQKRRAQKLSKPVLQYDKQGNLVQIWPSMREIERQLGFRSSNIWACCNGKYKSAYKFIWRYA